MKAIKILLGSVVLGLFFLGCNSTEIEKTASANEILATAEVSAPLQMVTFVPNEDNVKFLGRSYFDNDILWLGYTDCGAEFNVSAKQLDVTIAGDSAAYGGKPTDSSARIVAFVNGERKLDTMISKKEETFTVFQSDEVVEGLVQIIKVSECAQSLAGIKSVAIDEGGSITPASARGLKIEFIGDSITCGYGVDDLVKEHHFSTKTEDGSKTYAYKAAKTLDADYSMVSISGWGIISGYSGDGNKVATSQLPVYYDKLGFSWGNSFAGNRPQNVSWDFSKFVPDFVVVNLGTNDASYTKGQPKKIKEYSDAYVAFLKDIRSKNPDAYIICSLGIMGQDLCGGIEDAVADYTNQTGDTKVTSLKFNNQSMADGIAADWHPSEKTHAKAAALLVKKIKELM